MREKFSIRNIFRLFALMVGLVGLAGCAATPVTQSLTGSPSGDLPRAVELHGVPFHAQTRYHCGPAALATVLNHNGRKVTPDGLAQSVYTPGRQGTLQTEIVTGIRRQGRLAVRTGGMRAAFGEVADGNPVLLLQNLGLEIAPQWHYAVLVGYDLENETVVLRSGTTRRLVMDMQTLEHTWRRAGFWGVVVATPEGPVPRAASRAGWAGEALGLERAGHAEDALMAYLSAASHWPDDVRPLVSAANVLISAGDTAGAESRLRQALRRDDTHPVVLNNLAYVVMRRGRLNEAEALALRAVDAGGATLASARETLSEIREKQAAH